MTKLAWDLTSQRLYETGVSKGVLYLADPETGRYDMGYAWNGLTSVSESPSGAEANPFYADNIKYLNLISNEEFACTIGAYTYPKEFGVCDGSAEPVPGVSFGQQSRKPFGFSYQTKVGNDTLGDDYGYKIHLVYNGIAAPSEKEYATVNESPEPIEFSWEVTTTAVSAGEGRRPLSTITIDSTVVDKDRLQILEGILYGTASTNARLPMPEEVISIMEGTPLTQVTPTKPTFEKATGVITIPSVEGVEYRIDGVIKVGTFTIAEPGATETVVAVALPNFEIKSGSESSWEFTRDQS